jgi:hypothetical protein
MELVHGHGGGTALEIAFWPTNGIDAKMKLEEASQVHQRLCTRLNSGRTRVGRWVDREGVLGGVLRDYGVFRCLGLGKIHLAGSKGNRKLKTSQNKSQMGEY